MHRLLDVRRSSLLYNWALDPDARKRVAVLDSLFARHPITAVMHFAGLKAVGESVQKPLEYYDNNVHGTLRLLGAMRRANVKTLKVKT